MSDFKDKLSKLRRMATHSVSVEKINELWGADSEIHAEDLERASRDSIKLHSKYINLCMGEKVYFRNAVALRDEYRGIALAYYGGDLNTDRQYENYVWNEPWLKINKTNQAKSDALESDQLFVGLSLIIGEQEDKIWMLEQIIRSVNARSYDLNRIMEYRKFIAGG